MYSIIAQITFTLMLTLNVLTFLSSNKKNVKYKIETKEPEIHSNLRITSNNVSKK